jgi:hypothetical protein
VGELHFAEPAATLTGLPRLTRCLGNYWRELPKAEDLGADSMTS